MKNQTIAILSLVLTLTSVSPSRSNAMISLTGGPSGDPKPTAIAGGVLSGLGGMAIAAGALTGGVGLFFFLAGPAVGGILAIAGIVILDENGARKLQYVPVTNEDGAKLGLSDQEISSFNQDVETINALQDQISREADSIKNFDENMAGTMWTNGMNALNISNESRTALVKITASALKVAAPK
jgi:hypothetical protein